MDNDKTDIQVREALAFHLFTLNPPVRDNFEEAWRSEPQYRNTFRAQAEAFMVVLKDSGLRVAKASSKKLEARIDRLVTAPARTAYSVEGEAEGVTAPEVEEPA